MYTKLASAIYNDIYGGLKGMHPGNSLSLQQIEDEIVSTRLAVLKEFKMKGLVTDRDLTVAINCIDVDCKNLERCCLKDGTTPGRHFEIPQLLDGRASIFYIGTTDRSKAFTVYDGFEYKNFAEYRKRGRSLPYVYVDTAPNSSNMYDCYIFNAPQLSQVSVVAAFKDLRQLEPWACCLNLEELDIMPIIEDEIKRRIVQQKLRCYRQLSPQVTPNEQGYK